MTKFALFSVLAALATAATAQEQGRVLSATPVVQQVGIPQQVCDNEAIYSGSRNSGAGALLGAMHLVRDAHQMLHVVADFVRDDVGLGEFAGCVETLAEVAVEGEVDIDALVGRAVERSHRRLAGAAGGRCGAGEQH